MQTFEVKLTLSITEKTPSIKSRYFHANYFLEDTQQ